MYPLINISYGLLTVPMLIISVCYPPRRKKVQTYNKKRESKSKTMKEMNYLAATISIRIENYKIEPAINALNSSSSTHNLLSTSIILKLIPYISGKIKDIKIKNNEV